MNQNQKLTITLIAATFALIGVLVGILSYFRKKDAEFNESWNIGFDDDYDDYDCCCSDCNDDFGDEVSLDGVFVDDLDESILIEEDEITNI